MRELPKLPEDVIYRQQLILVARKLEDDNTNVKYTRLCKLGGFIIRRIDLFTDVNNYKKELSLCRESAITETRQKQIENIHEYVLSYLDDYIIEKYFP